MKGNYNEIREGDCLEKLKEIDDESIDLIATDPPYGYSFMNKDWDKAVVSVDVWRECLRVLKSGAFAFVMSAPRQDVLSRMIVNLQDAGFRTDFTSLYHSYASGFPKASNTEVVLRKRYETPSKSQMSDLWKTIIRKTECSQEGNNWLTLQEMLEDLEQGKQYKVYAYTTSEIKSGQIPERQRQSSMEGWNMLQKEKGQLCYCQICKVSVGLYFNGKKGWICHGTQADNGAVNWQTIDENGMRSSYQSQPIRQSFRELDVICNECITQKIRNANLSGSYLGLQPKPAVEVILCVQKPNKEKTFVDQALANGKGVTWFDDCRIPYQSQDDKPETRERTGRIFLAERGWNQNNMVRIEVANEKGRFPANLLVEDDALNDGKITGNTFRKGKQKKDGLYFFDQIKAQETVSGGYNDSGSYSRYFDLDAWYRAQFIITPKASPSERNGSIHPTMKPIKLMSYLITMGSRENDIVLDPFCGSGTTLIAAHQLNRRWIGIELNAEYAEIARKRMESYLIQQKLL